jgi:hypothetical protein
VDCSALTARLVILVSVFKIHFWEKLQNWFQGLMCHFIKTWFGPFVEEPVLFCFSLDLCIVSLPYCAMRSRALFISRTFFCQVP